jgi:hypothetical protein
MHFQSNITLDTPTEQFAAEVMEGVKGCRRRPECLATLRLMYFEHLAGLSENAKDSAKLKEWKRYISSMTRTTPSTNPSKRGQLQPPEKSGVVVSISTPPPTDFSGDPLTELSTLHGLMGSLLFEPDKDALTILLGAAATHTLKVDPVWLWLVSPASGGKNEHIDLLRKVPQVKGVDNLTPKTLLSGLGAKDAYEGNEPSLLLRYHDAIFINPDLSPLLNLRSDERAQIFAQLLRVYDGEYEPEVGTGKPLKWKGRITLLAGITPIIYSHYKTMATLGPRVLFLNLRQSNAQKQAEWVMSHHEDRGAIREELQARTAHLLSLLSTTLPTVPSTDILWYASLGNIVSHARSIVNHDANNDNDPEDVPGRELPGRVTNELKSLALGIALLLHHLELGPEERRLVLRVGLDTITPLRRHLLLQLFTNPGNGIAVLQKGSEASAMKVARGVEDLIWLGLVESKGLPGGQVYDLTPGTRQTLSVVLAS